MLLLIDLTNHKIKFGDFSAQSYDPVGEQGTLGKKSIKKMLPMQDGDVKRTWASISKITKDYNFQNNVSLDKGIEEFINWYRVYHKV